MLIVNTPLNPAGRGPERGGLGPDRGPARRHGCLCTVGRGLRGARLRRPPATRAFSAMRAFSSGVCGLLVRARPTMRPDGKSGYCVAAPPLTAEFPQGTPVPDLRASRRRCSTRSRIHARVAGDSRTSKAPSTRPGAIALRPCSRTHASGFARSMERLFQLADYSAISDLPDAPFCEELTRRHGVAAIPLSPFCDELPAAPAASDSLLCQARWNPRGRRRETWGCSGES